MWWKKKKKVERLSSDMTHGAAEAVVRKAPARVRVCVCARARVVSLNSKKPSRYGKCVTMSGRCFLRAD